MQHPVSISSEDDWHGSGLILATGDLRFKHPQDYSYSSSVDATQKGRSCLQQSQPSSQSMDEDCLFLNIQVPENTAPDANLPVMFWMYVSSVMHSTHNQV